MENTTQPEPVPPINTPSAQVDSEEQLYHSVFQKALLLNFIGGILVVALAYFVRSWSNAIFNYGLYVIPGLTILGLLVYGIKERMEKGTAKMLGYTFLFIACIPLIGFGVCLATVWGGMLLRPILNPVVQL